VRKQCHRIDCEELQFRVLDPYARRSSPFIESLGTHCDETLAPKLRLPSVSYRCERESRPKMEIPVILSGAAPSMRNLMAFSASIAIGSGLWFGTASVRRWMIGIAIEKKIRLILGASSILLLKLGRSKSISPLLRC
jgi:hypothetical protein